MMKYKLILTVLLICFIIAYGEFNNIKNTKTNQTSISVEDLKIKIEKYKAINIIDVRNEAEYYGNIGNIDGSKLIPLKSMVNSISELKKLDDEIYLVCLSGKRSSIAAQILRENGIEALNVKGGMLAWNKI